MEDNSSEVNKKIPTNLVSKEERYLRMFFTYIRLDKEKVQSKISLEKILLKDKNAYNESIEMLKNDWITVYYNIYDYFIINQDNIYTYFYNELLYLCKEESDKNKELKNIVISIMKICLRIYPPSREDIFNFYQLFRLKELDQKIFSTLMEIFNILFTYDKLTSSYKEYFSKFDEKEFFIFDGNSHIEINLDKKWLDSGFRENPKSDSSKTYYVLGFSFRYFKKFDNTKLVQVKFHSNKLIIFSIRNGILHCNLPFKNNAQISIEENKDYVFNMAFLKERIQIHINDTFYETEEGFSETAKNIIVGEKFFGLFYKIFSTFTFEPLVYNNGIVEFTHPDGGGKFHFFNVSPYNVYESITYPKKIHFLKKVSYVDVNFSGRVLFFKTEKTYMKSLKNYGTFDTFCILLMFFIYKPEYYKKEYIKLIFEKINEECLIYENEKLFAENNYFVQCCIILCNFPKENRDLELVDYISPLIKYSCGYNYYLDIVKLVYGYEPDTNKQPFSYHLIELMIKKLLKVGKISQLYEIGEVLLNTIKFFNKGFAFQKEEDNIAGDIYYIIYSFFKSYKSNDENIFFNKPYYFWFITLYIFFFELKDKIKEIETIYNSIKEELNKETIIEENDGNEYLIKLINYYIILSNDEKVNFNFSPKNEKEITSYLYISYIFKLYARYKKNENFQDSIDFNIKDIKNIICKYKFETIDDYKNKSISYFLIPCIYNLPYLSNSFKKDECSIILELLFQDILSNKTKNVILSDLIKLFKNICINLKYVCSDSNKYLVYYIKNEIFKQIKKYDFKVDNSFYKIFEKDEETAKLLSIDISNLFGDLYSQLKKDKTDKKTIHNITEDKLKEYLDPSDDLYQSDYLISHSNLDEIRSNMVSRKNWIRTTQDDQFYYNQNWSDLDFCYNPENKNPKFTTKAAGTNDLKYPYLYRIPNISKLIKTRNKKGKSMDQLSNLFNEEVKEPFPVCVHISTKDIKLNLDFILKYHESVNKQIEKEYLFDNKKKYPCCIIGSTVGKGFFYIKDEKTIEYANYYEIEKAENYDYIDNFKGITTDRKYFYNPIKIYKITIKKESIKMFFKRIINYEDQGLEIFLFLGGSWYFIFKEKRDEFLEESGLVLKNDKDKNKEKENNKPINNGIYEKDWKDKYLFRTLYNDLNHKSSIFSKSVIKEPIGYISKYFRFPGDNKYWENTCLSDVLRRWKNHEISTYTFLMYLNLFAGRSIEDKSQNPIMPQLILLNNENKVVLRNLKLPMGQQKIENNQNNINRITQYDNLYKKEKNKKKAFYYPSSVSTEKSVCKYLSQLIPYNQIAKNLFDDKENFLTSINKEIIDSLTNINNVNESIPDFFYLFACFKNINDIKNGNKEGIELPNIDIINNTNYNFDKSILYVLTLNKILESKEVNDTIGNWIDLIFGIDQHSEKLKNIYKPECYINDKSQIEIFKKDENIIDNIKTTGTLPFQLLKSSKFNTLITRKYLPLNFDFKVKEALTVTISNIDSSQMLNFAALDSEKFVFYGECKIWNIDCKTLKNNEMIYSFTLNYKDGIIKELFNPKNFKKIFALSRLYKYSIHGGNIEDILMFYNHRNFNRAYSDGSKNKNFITAVEIIDYVGYEHYLLVGKQNGHIHHYKVDFETLDDIFNYPDDTQYPAFFFKSILRYHNKEISSLKYNCYLNLWISTSKDGFVHIWNYNGYPILSVCIKNKNIKYGILASDPIPSFVVYCDNELYCYILNQITPVRQLKFENELYNFDIIKSNCFEDFLICQDENKIYIISLPYLEIVSEINEKVTSFDYLSNEKLIIGFLRHDNENKVTIKKIICDI